MASHNSCNSDECDKSDDSTGLQNINKKNHYLKLYPNMQVAVQHLCKGLVFAHIFKKRLA